MKFLDFQLLSFYAERDMNNIPGLDMFQNFAAMQQFNAPISSHTAKTYLYVVLTIIIAIIIDNALKSFVKVPKSFDSKRARTYVSIFKSIITILVYTIALHIVLTELNIDITPLLASAGIVSIILGISARPIIEDLITGLFLLSQSSIAVGDYVKIETIEGNIDSIGFRTLTIRGGDGGLYIIPNGQVKKLVNYSRHKATVTIDIPVKSDQKIDLVKKAAEEAMDELKKDEDIAANIYNGSLVNGISGYKEMGIMMFQVIIVTTPALRWKVGTKYRYLAKKAFEKHKIVFG